jgi:hypothetical protein
MQSSGGTFYSCFKGEQNVQTRILTHFASLIFEQPDDVLNSPTKYPLCLKHKIVKLWIIRHCPVGTQLSEAQFRASAINFLNYHKSKPTRILCRILFAQLAADALECAVVLRRECQWFYPLNLEWDIKWKTVLIDYDPIAKTFQHISEEFVLMFSLRKSITIRRGCHSNVEVGKFKQISAHCSVFEGFEDAKEDGDQKVTYQIYPGDKNKTFYQLPEDMFLFVFCANGENAVVSVAERVEHDQYVYFERPLDCKAVIVVLAKNAIDAREFVKLEAKYSV